jgi:hypothetical protein
VKHERLSVERLDQRLPLDADDTLGEARVIRPTDNSPAVVSGARIESATDVDMYKFYAANGKVSIDIDTKTNGAPGLGSYIRVFDAAGRQIAANNDGQAPNEPPIPSRRDANNKFFDSYIEFHNSTPRWLFVGVSNWQNTRYSPVTGNGDSKGSRHLTGAYSLEVRASSTITSDSETIARKNLNDFIPPFGDYAVTFKIPKDATWTVRGINPKAQATLTESRLEGGWPPANSTSYHPQNYVVGEERFLVFNAGYAARLKGGYRWESQLSDWARSLRLDVRV